MSIIRMNGLKKQLLIQQNPDIFHQTERLNNIMKNLESETSKIRVTKR